MKHDNPWNLSEQEAVLVDHMSTGLRSSDIAAKMGLSPKTVEVYRSHAPNKMGCQASSIRAAVLWDRFAFGRDEQDDSGRAT